MKILNDIRRAKNFFINWKDDSKPRNNGEDWTS